MCKQQRQPDNRNDNSHKSRSDSRAAKITQCKPSLDDAEQNYMQQYKVTWNKKVAVTFGKNCTLMI